MKESIKRFFKTKWRWFAGLFVGVALAANVEAPVPAAAPTLLTASSVKSLSLTTLRDTAPDLVLSIESIASNILAEQDVFLLANGKYKQRINYYPVPGWKINVDEAQYPDGERGYRATIQTSFNGATITRFISGHSKTGVLQGWK